MKRVDAGRGEDGRVGFQIAASDEAAKDTIVVAENVVDARDPENGVVADGLIDAVVEPSGSGAGYIRGGIERG